MATTRYRTSGVVGIHFEIDAYVNDSIQVDSGMITDGEYLSIYIGNNAFNIYGSDEQMTIVLDKLITALQTTRRARRRAMANG